jgi:hypothetical protein
MKFKYVNIDAIRSFFPKWASNYMSFARGLDDCLEKYERLSRCNPNITLPFMIEVRTAVREVEYTILESADSNDPDQEIGTLLVCGPRWEISVPLNCILRGYRSSNDTYCVYSHGIATETPLVYIGISSRPWFVRYAEHESASRSGSAFLFHDALRKHSEKHITHRVLAEGLNRDDAMAYEEYLVAQHSLYPVGLNMIPGGYAGIKYLSTLSIGLRDTEYVAESIANAMCRDSISGKPNPLCSARWQSDPDYAARVICGHHGRLTVDQVKMIRSLRMTCRSAEDISAIVNANNLAQVKRVLADRTYSRIQ